MYVIWYLFEKNDHDKIMGIKKELSKQYEIPMFVPHITVYGPIDINIKILEKIILDSIKDIKSFSVKKNAILFSDNFWKTLFIDFKNNESMSKINNKLTKNLSKFSKYDFKPHASLMYKKINYKEKQKLSQNIQIKNDFKIDSIGIIKFSESIEEWKIIKKIPLEKFE